VYTFYNGQTQEAGGFIANICAGAVDNTFNNRIDVKMWALSMTIMFSVHVAELLFIDPN